MTTQDSQRLQLEIVGSELRIVLFFTTIIVSNAWPKLLYLFVSFIDEKNLQRILLT